MGGKGEEDWADGWVHCRLGPELLSKKERKKERKQASDDKQHDSRVLDLLSDEVSKC